MIERIWFESMTPAALTFLLENSCRLLNDGRYALNHFASESQPRSVIITQIASKDQQRRLSRGLITIDDLTDSPPWIGTICPSSIKMHPLALQKNIMRKIIVTEFITLDGVVEAPGGDETDHPHGGWNAKLRHPESGKYKVDELAAADALLLGKKTYDQFAAYWPHQSGGGFADRINALPKYIVSSSLPTAVWNNSHILRDVAKDVAELKKTKGGDILVYGSATLSKALLHHDLIDQLTLFLHPVSVGGGLKLFDDDRGLKNFKLKSSRALDNGVIILEYLPKS